MNSKTQKNLNVERNLRDVSISRRGGVRTRGGRLPPINMRDITQVIGTKKVVVPNIPQRRAVVNRGETRDISGESLHLKAESRDNSPRPRRGRSAKVILQTEGSFLAEGPAARIKRDQAGLDISYSLPRVSVKGRKSEIKYDPELIKDMLSTYDSISFYDDFSEKPPHRFPLLKQKSIKTEFDEDGDCMKVKIKKEITENAEIEEPKTEFKKSLRIAEYFQDLKDDTKLILLKLPSHLHFMKQEVIIDSDDSVKEKSTEDKGQVKETDIENEGFIGKLRFMRSGRVKLVLGEIELELTDDKLLESYMEAATIRVQEDMADLTILGKIDRRVALSPDVNKLINKGKSVSFE